MHTHAGREAHWKRVRRLTLSLLALWFFTTVLSVWFARELTHIHLFGWPLSFYLASQGSILIYVAIIGIYSWRMRRLDRRFAQDQHGD